MNDSQFHSFLMLVFKMILSSSRGMTCGFPLKTFYPITRQLLTAPCTLKKRKKRQHKKLREKSWANWLSRDKTHCLRIWQVYGPELQRNNPERKWPTWQSKFTVQSRSPSCPALFQLLTSLRLCPTLFMPHIQGLQSSWWTQRDTGNH